MLPSRRTRATRCVMSVTSRCTQRWELSVINWQWPSVKLVDNGQRTVYGEISVLKSWQKVSEGSSLSLSYPNFFITYYYYYTRNTFNGPFSGTTQVSRYQKGKTNLDFTEARDSEWQWHQLDCMQVCTSLQTDNHASTPPLRFLQAGCPSCRPTNSIKALKEFLHNIV